MLMLAYIIIMIASCDSIGYLFECSAVPRRVVQAAAM